MIRQERQPHPGRTDSVKTLVQGALIGIANIIPGVSGGTFALILGVFDRMIAALNGISVESVKELLVALGGDWGREPRKRIARAWARLDANFMILLCAGALAAILLSSFLIDFLLKEQYSPTLAFFVGLILPSVAIPWGMMARRGLRLAWVIPGVLLTVGVTWIMPEQAAGSDNLLLAAAAGAIAVSAMILPGLSGSYVLLVMGQYQNVLAKLTSFQRSLAEGTLDFGALAWLAAFSVGLVFGILLFARLLHFLLARFRSTTMAFLIGLLLGSLWVLWPFKEIAAGAEIVGRNGEVQREIRIATAPNRLPQTTKEAGIAAGALAAGLVASAGMIRLGKREEAS